MYEVIVVLFFWLVLFPPKLKKENETHIFLLECADHLLPFVYLVIEYTLFNKVPFLRRHFPFVIALVFSYLVFNCIYSLAHKPVYAPMTWNSAVGVALPLAFFFLGVGMLFLIEFCTKKKLIFQGHSDIIEILEGNKSEK